METFSALLAICAGNSPVTGEFPAQRPVTRSFDIFFDLRLNKRLSKQSWGWWFKTWSRPWWRHCKGMEALVIRLCLLLSSITRQKISPCLMIPVIISSIISMMSRQHLIVIIVCRCGFILNDPQRRILLNKPILASKMRIALQWVDDHGRCWCLYLVTSYKKCYIFALYSCSPQRNDTGDWTLSYTVIKTYQSYIWKWRNSL